MPTRARISSFLGELQRRHVIKVAIVYVVVGLGVAQAADVFLGNLAPQWVLDAALVLLLLGLPISIVLAWAYDITPSGLVKGSEEGAERSTSRVPEVVAAASADRRTIAVLPFANFSSDPENEFFADGVTDDILTALTLVEGLKVTSRTSAMRYKGTEKGLRAIAGELGVGTILEGSVRRSNDRVRVVVQLVDAGTDAHLWAETYDRELKDILAVQTDVAKAVARALRSQLLPHGIARLAVRPTQNIQAYELVTRARHAYLQVTPDHVGHGMALLKQAIELDPQYAVAWAHLAIAHFVLPYFSTVSPASIQASAREAIDRAFELDPNLPEAHIARAYWRFNFRFDWEGAERDFAEALRLNPSSADAYQWRGLMRLLCRKTAESIRDARESVALDPLSFQTRSQLAQNLLWGGQTEEAKAILLEIIDDDPTNFISHWALGIILRPTDPDAALAHLEAGLAEMDVPLGHASRALTLRALGRNSEADQITVELEARASGAEYVSPFALALAYFGKGDLDRGFSYLEEGVDKRDFLSLYMRLVAPAFGLESHPRFQALGRRIWPNDFPTAASPSASPTPQTRPSSPRSP